LYKQRRAAEQAVRRTSGEAWRVARMCGIVWAGGGQGGRGARCKERRARDGLGQTDSVGCEQCGCGAAAGD
jgi:hypothetical protein